MERTVEDIEDEMRSLYPQKELAYIDYYENKGADDDLRDRLFHEFDTLRNRWNKLVVERKRLLGID